PLLLNKHGSTQPSQPQGPLHQHKDCPPSSARVHAAPPTQRVLPQVPRGGSPTPLAQCRELHPVVPSPPARLQLPPGQRYTPHLLARGAARLLAASVWQVRVFAARAKVLSATAPDQRSAPEPLLCLQPRTPQAP